jgi:Uma2 family endonuclease
MATTRLWTAEDLEREGAPEGRYELIDGELVEMPPSGGEASSVGTMVIYHLVSHVVPRKLGKIYGADGGFVIFPGRDLMRVPDVAFVSADRLPPPAEHRGFLRLAPDLVVEVVSPSDRMTDVMAKVAMWLEAGVGLVWVVEPDERVVTVVGPDRTPRRLGVGDELDGGEVLPDFRVAVAELFG